MSQIDRQGPHLPPLSDSFCVCWSAKAHTVRQETALWRRTFLGFRARLMIGTMPGIFLPTGPRRNHIPCIVSSDSAMTDDRGKLWPPSAPPPAYPPNYTG